MGPRFKVSFERPEKQAFDLVIPGLVVQHVIHYTTPTPTPYCCHGYYVLLWWWGGASLWELEHNNNLISWSKLAPLGANSFLKS